MRGSLLVLVALVVGALTSVASPISALAGEPTPADVFRVDLGTPESLLNTIARAALPCQASGSPKSALVCRGGMGGTVVPVPDSTTFWLKDERVSKIFEVTRLADGSYSRCLDWVRERTQQIETILGQPPTIPFSEPSWAKGMDDGRKLEMLGQGRLGGKAIWRFPGRDLSVGLYADKGAPVLVVGLEPGAAPRCDHQGVAAMLMDLFPPASPMARAVAAQGLAACKVTGAAGALAAAAKTSEESSVRAGAVRALDAIGPAGLPHLEAIARDSKQGETAELAAGVVAKHKAASRDAPASAPAVTPSKPSARAKAPAVAAPAVGKPAERPADDVATAPVPPLPDSAAPSATAATYEKLPAAAPVESAARDEAKPAEPDEASEPEEEAAPKGPPDGTVLALTTSLVAGGVWGGGLSLLAQQNSPKVLLLVGTAGAVIGGGTAWGLTHFGLRPSPSQAMWFTNSTAWGTLAGLMAWAGSGSDSEKLKWGLLVGGESIGMGLGVLGARKWEWSGSQILFANSLVLGAGLLGAGSTSIADPGKPIRVSPLAGYGTAPAMLGAAVLSRYVAPSRNDLHLLGATSAALAWSGGLLAYGIDTDESTRGDRLGGGLMAGIGAGYLGAAALSPFVEVSPRRTWTAAGGMLAGNLIGLGSYMMIEPDATARRPLWASVGGMGLGVGTFLAYPRLRLGDQAALMAAVGAAYGVGTWGLAMLSSNNESPGRGQGGIMALGTAGGIAGLLASGHFYPGAADYPVTLASAALAATAGIGVGKLATDSTGTGELVGSLAGSATGFATGALFSHYSHLRAPDVAAAGLGGGYGALAGALVPTLANAEWGGWTRDNQGSLLVGLPAGVFAGAALSRFANSSGASVGIAGVGATLGLSMGVGSGLLRADGYSQPARIGALTGATAGMAGALLLAKPLRLDEGLGESATSLGLAGTALGAVQGVLLAGIADPSGQVSGTSSRQVFGGMLLGGSTGLASGLLLSKYHAPTGKNLAVAALGDGMGALMARGLVMQMFDEGGRKDTAATLAGSLAGLGGAALVEYVSPLLSTDLLAGFEGLAFGGVVGSLAPTLADERWGGWRRSTEGGLMLGMGGGALAAAGLSHVVRPERGTLAVSASGGLLGLGMGVGAGLLWPDDYSRPTRVGAVAGITAGMATGLLLDRSLRLRDGLGESAPELGGVGMGIGIAQGILLAALLDPSGEVKGSSDRQLRGGALLGGSAGLASGLLLSKFAAPGPRELAVTVGGTVMGGLFGRGLMMTASPSDGRRDTAGTMAGALLGTTAFALTERYSPLSETDLVASSAGMAMGGVVGALAPTLSDAEWGGWRRGTQGGLMLGLSAGAVSAAALSHATNVSGRTLGLGLAGALDGALTGAGIGILADDVPGSSQGARIGLVAGAAGGLALGFGLLPRLEYSTDNLVFLSAVSAVGGWTGAWSQVLGHQSWGSVDSANVRGGILAGAGGASILTAALLPALAVDTDMIGNALLLDGVFTGAGAGIGALASRRADAPVWGMLGAGTAGLVLGGALHQSINLEESAGLLSFGALEGLWMGGWLPYVLRPSSEVTTSDNAAGLAAGGLGGLGLSMVASAAGTPSGQALGMASVGSAIGASLAGGSVLLAEEVHDRRGVGIMLGGTAVGLGLGALVSPYVPLDGRRATHMLAGASFGAAEGLAFAWAGRSNTNSQYAGSALVGAGLGATLGLASTAYVDRLDGQQALVASGFSAWGGWVGSFAGAYANRDPHEVVLGGLVAANVGFLAGYGALSYDLVSPRDFGWLSLAGAMGTALGGGVGAVFSSQDNPRPVLAGLALGPAVGIGVGSLVVPYLRHRAEAAAAFVPSMRVAGVRFETPMESGKQRTSTDVLAERKPSRILAGLKLAQHHLFDVTNWTPVFGSLPPVPGDPNPAPLFMGVSGGLR